METEGFGADAEKESKGFTFLGNSSTDSGNGTEQLDGLFGGLNLAQPGVQSLFPTSSESPKEGFSFLEQPSESAPSAFSFMSPTQAAAVPEEESSTPGVSGFNFLVSSSDSTTPSTVPNLIGEPIETAAQEIKLAKVASTKAVIKKKKKSARVGFGREEEDEGDELPATPPPPPPSAPALDLPTGLRAPTISESPSVSKTAAASTVAPTHTPTQTPAPTPTPTTKDTARTSPVPTGPQASPEAVTVPNYQPAAPPASSTLKAGERQGGKDNAHDHKAAVNGGGASSAGGPGPEQSEGFSAASVISGVFNMFRGGGAGAAAPAPAPTPVPRAAPPARPFAPVTVPAQQARPSPVPPSGPPSPAHRQGSGSGSGAGAPAALAEAAAPVTSVTTPTQTPAPVAPAAPAPAPAPTPAPAPAPAPTPAPASTTALNQTIQALESYEASAAAAARDIARISAAATAATTRADGKEAAVRATEGRISDIEAEQAALAAAEEFYRADALSGLLLALRQELDATLAAVGEMRVTARGLHEQLLALKKQQRGELGEVLSSLRHSAAAVSSEQRRVATEAEGRRRGLAERLQTEEHRLQLEQRHLARDCDALEEESAATEAAIASQLGPAGEARDTLKHQCATLDDEVSKLERQLAAKRAAAQTAHAELAAAEAAVSDVRKRFDRQLSRIADRRAALDATRRECCQEESLLEADRQRLSAETAAEEKAAREAESWTKGIDAELSVGLLLQAALEDTPGWQGREQGQQGSGGGAVGHAWGVDPALRTELAEALLALQAATSVSSEVQLALDALVEESASLTEQLPKLEAEKKAHAAARRFKEAAQSSKDHKAMSARKEEVDAAMGEAKARLELRLEAVEQCRSRQVVASGAVERAEAAARDQRFEVLLENARGLRGRVLRLALEPEGGRESGLSIKRAAVLLLEAEIECVLSEAQALKPDWDRESVALDPPQPDPESHGATATTASATSVASASASAAASAARAAFDADCAEAEAAAEAAAVVSAAASAAASSPSLSSLASSSASASASASASVSNGQGHDAINGSTKSPRPRTGSGEAPASPSPSPSSPSQASASPPSSSSPSPSPSTSRAERVSSGGATATATATATKREALSLLLSIDAAEAEIEAALVDEDFDAAAEAEERKQAAEADVEEILGRLKITREELRSAGNK